MTTLSALATRTISGKTPPVAFLVTLWALAIFFAGSTIALVYFGIRDQRAARRRQIADPAGAIDPTGHAGRAGCLLVTAVPCALLALLFVEWLIGVS